MQEADRMSVTVLPSLALEQIEAIVWSLSAQWHSFDPDLRDRIEALYADFRSRYAAASSAHEQGMVAAAFVAELDALPQVRDAIGERLDAAKGHVRRGDRVEGVDDLLDRIPPWITPLMSAAPPPEPSMALPPAPAPAAAPPAFGGGFDGDDTLGSSVTSAPASPTRGDQAAESVTAATDATPALTRYPNLDCQDQVALNQKLSLFVQLLREATSPTMTAITIVDTGEPAQLPEVEVVLRARGFDIAGGDTRTLPVLRDDDSEERFVLTPRVTGEQQLRVDFYQWGRYIGTVKRNVLVTNAPQAVEIEQPDAPIALTIAASQTVPPPDLELRVELDRHDGRTLYFELHATRDDVSYNHADMGKVTLSATPLDKMQTIYAELTQLARAVPATPDAIAEQQRRLARLGNQLWKELFSPELQASYWQWKDRVRTLQITSDEPWIPWEIVKPFRFDASNVRVDEPFLCEGFQLSRWLCGPGPADRLPVQRVRPVAPSSVNLPSVQAELKYLETINQLRPDLVPDVPYNGVSQVIDLFENGAFSILHFAAHGTFDARQPDNSAITLTGGALRPSDIVALFGGARPRPLIFINACHGARTEFGLTGLGGWADRLVRQAGVAAFVGAAWEVSDTLALQFAQEFYTALLRDGKPIGESFQQARCKIRDAAPSNSTWLAYVLYADPAACVTTVA
jgi:hypothetical protein